jgi:parallel beta-helix repeat protein
MFKNHKVVFPTLIFVASSLLPLASWGVTNTVVGGCYPGPQFTTIQAAVEAASSGGTVRVCPGTYPEQVTIDHDLTLTGVGIGADAVIVPPAAGLVTTADLDGGQYTAQLQAVGANVTVNNIAVDGEAQKSCFDAGEWIGILYLEAGGAIRNSTVRNGPYCAGTTAILAYHTSNLKILNNNARECIYCIALKGAANSTISANILTQGGIVPPFVGVDVQSSPGPTMITNNIIVAMQSAGIHVVSSTLVTISENMIPESFDSFGLGIYLAGVTASTVQNNRITSAYQGIAIDDKGQSGKNTVNHNVISDSTCGLAVGLTLNDNVSPNTFFTTSQGYCVTPLQ